MKNFRSRKTMQAVLALVLGMSFVMPVEAAKTIDIPSAAYSSDYTEPSFNSGDTMNIRNGATGTIADMTGGMQNIYTGATGKITDMTGGKQYIYGEGSKGYIGTYTRTGQTGPKGQGISGGGYGRIDSLNNYYAIQNIYMGSTGSIGILEDGSQYIGDNDQTNTDAKGYIDTMKGGSQYIYKQGEGTVTIMNGGGQSIYEGATGIIENLNDGFQRIYNGATGTVKSLNSGRVYVRGTSKNTVINGGNMFFHDAGAKIEDLTINSGNLYLKYKEVNKAEFALNGDFNFAGGIVDIANEASVSSSILTTTLKHSYETLTIENLTKGGGTFIMNTDLASQTDSDKITINNSTANETTYIEVKDKSKTDNTEVTGKKKLLLVTVNNGSANFAGKNINEGGIWEVTPTIERGDRVNGADGNPIGEANEWYLTNFTKAINEDTMVLLHRADNSYALWRNTNDSLRKRLGELRPASGTGDGIWAKYLGGKFDGMGYEGNYNLYQLGYDKAADAKSTYGFVVEKGSGKASYELGSGKDELVVGSVYGVWTGDDGSYTDVVARVGQFDSDVKTYGQYPDKADYKTKAYSLSAEYGKNIALSEIAGTYVEPQAQFIMGRLASTSYVSDRGHYVQLGGD